MILGPNWEGPGKDLNCLPTKNAEDKDMDLSPMINQSQLWADQSSKDNFCHICICCNWEIQCPDLADIWPWFKVRNYMLYWIDIGHTEGGNWALSSTENIPESHNESDLWTFNGKPSAGGQDKGMATSLMLLARDASGSSQLLRVMPWGPASSTR